MKEKILVEISLWFDEMKSGLLLAERFSKRVDQLVCSIFNSVDKKMRAALIATGGYGRNELCPYSDIDIMFFAPDRVDTVSVEKMLVTEEIQGYYFFLDIIISL